MFFLSDMDLASFEGKKNRSGRKKGSKNRIQRSSRAEVVYKTELTPIQKLRDISIAYKNIVSPSASLLKAGTGTGRLLHQMNIDKIRMQSVPAEPKSPGFFNKLGGFYDKSLGRVRGTASAGKSAKYIYKEAGKVPTDKITNRFIKLAAMRVSYPKPLGLPSRD